MGTPDARWCGHWLLQDRCRSCQHQADREERAKQRRREQERGGRFSWWSLL